MAVTVLQLRSDLATLLQDQLGRYNLPNGYYTPAVIVQEDAEDVTAASTTSGLELVISAQPDPRPLPNYRTPPSSETWTVYLKEWSDTGLTSYASRRIRWAYPGSQVDPVRPRSSRGPLRQVRIRIPDPNPLSPAVLTGAAQPEQDYGTTRAIVLRYELQLLLNSYIGTYFYSNGEQASAIYVEEDVTPTTSDRRVQGLEVIVATQPNLLPVSSYAEQFSSDSWTVTLKDWDSPGVATEAAELIATAYTNTSISRINLPSRAGPKSALQVTLRDPRPLDTGYVTPSIYFMLSEAIGDTLISESNIPFFLENAP